MYVRNINGNSNVNQRTRVGPYVIGTPLVTQNQFEAKTHSRHESSTLFNALEPRTRVPFVVKMVRPFHATGSSSTGLPFQRSNTGTTHSNIPPNQSGSSIPTQGAYISVRRGTHSAMSTFSGTGVGSNGSRKMLYSAPTALPIVDQLEILRRLKGTGDEAILRHVCFPVDVYRNGDDMFVFFERVQPGDIRSLLAREGRRGFRETVCRRYVRQLAEVLQSMHARGFLHGALRLENILVNSDGVVQLTGFSRARHIPQIDKEVVEVTKSPLVTSPALNRLRPTDESSPLAAEDDEQNNTDPAWQDAAFHSRNAPSPGLTSMSPGRYLSYVEDRRSPSRAVAPVRSSGELSVPRYLSPEDIRLSFQQRIGLNRESGGEVQIGEGFPSKKLLQKDTLECMLSYDPFKAEVWALGVCAYKLLTGIYPYQKKSFGTSSVARSASPQLGSPARRYESSSPSRSKLARCSEPSGKHSPSASPRGQDVNKQPATLCEASVETRITWESLPFPSYVSPLAQDFVRSMLHPVPSQRVGLVEVLRHAWFLEGAAPTTYHEALQELSYLRNRTNLAVADIRRHSHLRHRHNPSTREGRTRVVPTPSKAPKYTRTHTYGATQRSKNPAGGRAFDATPSNQNSRAGRSGAQLSTAYSSKKNRTGTPKGMIAPVDDSSSTWSHIPDNNPSRTNRPVPTRGLKDGSDGPDYSEGYLSDTTNAATPTTSDPAYAMNLRTPSDSSATASTNISKGAKLEYAMFDSASILSLNALDMPLTVTPPSPVRVRRWSGDAGPIRSSMKKDSSSPKTSPLQAHTHAASDRDVEWTNISVVSPQRRVKISSEDAQSYFPRDEGLKGTTAYRNEISDSNSTFTSSSEVKRTAAADFKKLPHHTATSNLRRPAPTRTNASSGAGSRLQKHFRSGPTGSRSEKSLPNTFQYSATHQGSPQVRGDLVGSPVHKLVNYYSSVNWNTVTTPARSEAPRVRSAVARSRMHSDSISDGRKFSGSNGRRDQAGRTFTSDLLETSSFNSSPSKRTPKRWNHGAQSAPSSPSNVHDGLTPSSSGSTRRSRPASGFHSTTNTIALVTHEVTSPLKLRFVSGPKLQRVTSATKQVRPYPKAILKQSG